MNSERAIRISSLRDQCEKILYIAFTFKTSADDILVNIVNEMNYIRISENVHPIGLEILKAVFIILGNSDENLIWENIRIKIFKSKKLYLSMKDFDSNKPLPLEIKERVYPILFEQSITEDSIKSVCIKCLPFYIWACNIVKCSETLEKFVTLTAEYKALLLSPN